VTTALLVLIVAAALVCPLQMLWAMRRGKRPACCPPRKTSEIDVLRERQRVLAAQLARAESRTDAAAVRTREANV
jgi:hypothetical protein